MRPLLIFILSLFTSFSFGQRMVGDTITNWQVYRDKVLILAGNEVMGFDRLPKSTVHLKDKFDHIKIDFFYDFYVGDLERMIQFFIDEKMIGEFKINASLMDPIIIPKSFLVKKFKKRLNEPVLVRYVDNEYYHKGIPIGLITFSK